MRDLLGAAEPGCTRLRRRIVVALVLAASVVASGLVHPPAAHAATNRISGTVTVGGEPVAGVELELAKWTGTEWSYGYGNDEDGLTDAVGEFEYVDLAPGSYTVTVHRRFPNGTTAPPASPADVGAVTIDADDQVRLDLALPVPERSVTGQVLRLDGAPAAGAWVELGQWSAQDHPRFLFSTRADAEGRYVLPLYDDVDHTVTAWSPGFLRTLLGDVTHYWDAQSFGLAGGPGLPTITLQSQYLGGLVTTAAGAPAPGRSLALLRWNHAQDVWDEVATGTTSVTGRYAFLNTGEGHFTVRAADALGQVHPTTGLDVPYVTGYAIDQSSGPGYRWVSGSGQIGDLDLALPPPAAVGLRLSGSLAVGQTLRAHPGAWAGHYAVAYQWLRDGTPIPAATAPTYRLVAADGRRRIAVVATAASGFPGLQDQVLSSPSAPVRARSVLALRAVPGRRTARLVVRLRCPGTSPASTTARIAVHVDGRRRAVVRLRSGRATLNVGRLTAGRHRIVVRFAGSSGYTAAQAVRTVRIR